MFPAILKKTFRGNCDDMMDSNGNTLGQEVEPGNTNISFDSIEIGQVFQRLDINRLGEGRKIVPAFIIVQ